MQKDAHAGLPPLEDDGEDDAEEKKGGDHDDLSSDLSDDDDEGGDLGSPSDISAKARVGVLNSECDRHSEFSVSADEDELSNPIDKKSRGREAKSKSIFEDTDGSSDESGGLFDRRPPAMVTRIQGEETSSNEEVHSVGDDEDDGTPERGDKDGRKEIIKPKPVKPVMLGFAAELARKIGAPPPSWRPGDPQSVIDPGATGDHGDVKQTRRSKSSPPESKSENLEVDKVQKSRSAGNARGRQTGFKEGPFLVDSSSEEELFRPARAATRNVGSPVTFGARKTLFDSGSDSDEGLFSARSKSLSSSKVLTSYPDSNTPYAPNSRQDRKSNSEYPSAPNQIRPYDDFDVRKPQIWLARESPAKKTLFEDTNEEADGGMISHDEMPALSELVENRPQILVMPPSGAAGVKHLNDDNEAMNSIMNEGTSKYPGEFSYKGEKATQSVISGAHPYREKDNLERVNTREECMIINSRQTGPNTAVANPATHDQLSVMSNQKMTAPRREASLTDIFHDDSDSDDIFSTLMIQSRKVINSDINRVDKKIPSDEGLTNKKPRRWPNFGKPVMRKTDERRTIFGSSAEDDDSGGGLFANPMPQEKSSSVVAEKRGGGLFASSSGEDNILETKTNEGRTLAPTVISESKNHSDEQDLAPACTDGNAPSPQPNPAASTSNLRSGNTSGDDGKDNDDEDPSAGMATRFGGARPKSLSSTRMTQDSGDTKDAAERPRRLHVPRFGTAFKNSLSATLAKGPVSPGSVSSATQEERYPGIMAPPEKEQMAKANVEKPREVDEDTELLIGAVKHRAKMARPKRRLPSRYMRNKSSLQKDVVDSPSFVQNYATSSTRRRSDIGSCPDPSRLPPPLSQYSSRSEDSASAGTKSPFPVGKEEIEEATKETELPTEAIPPPHWSKKTQLPVSNVEEIGNQVLTSKRGGITSTEDENQETQRPAGEVDGKEEKADIGLHKREHTTNAIQTKKNKSTGSLFESSSDSEDLFANKPVQDVVAVGNVRVKPEPGLFESSSDSEDLFSSATRMN